MDDSNLGVGPGTFDKPNLIRAGSIECACATDVSLTRSVNGDSAFIFLQILNDIPFGFLAVADGVDGMFSDGKLASSIALQKITQGILQLTQNSQIILPDANFLTDLFKEANQAILSEEKNLYKDFATTFSCLTFYGSEAIVGHVGDSRIYAFEQRTGKLVQATKEHTVVQRLVETGHLSAEEAKNHPQRSFLYKSLGGQRGEIVPDIQTLSLASISHIVLCSDGLWKLVSDQTILQILISSPTPANACQRLIQTANDAGGTDNITVIICKLEN